MINVWLTDLYMQKWKKHEKEKNPIRRGLLSYDLRQIRNKMTEEDIASVEYQILQIRASIVRGDKS